MAKVAILDDFDAHAHVFAAPLVLAGHDVLTEVTDIDWDRVMAFQPEVISVVLYRQACAFNRPITDPNRDILGMDAIHAMEKYPAIQVVPIALVGNGIDEADVPTTINYDMFLTFPSDIGLYLPKIEELATKVKTRRKISHYTCPHCRSRMVFLKAPQRELFCPRCHTAVSLVDDQHGVMMVEGTGVSVPVKVSDMQPPARAN